MTVRSAGIPSLRSGQALPAVTRASPPARGLRRDASATAAETAALRHYGQKEKLDTIIKRMLPYTFRRCRAASVMTYTFQFAFSYRFPYYGEAGRLATVHGDLSSS